MGLQADRTGGQARLLARVGAFLARILVIGHLDPVYPHAQMPPLGHDGLGEELVVVRHHPPRRLVKIHASGAEIDGGGAVAFLVLVADLNLVPRPELPLVGAEKHAAVGVVGSIQGVGTDIELGDEVGPGAVGLDLTGTLLHMNGPVLDRPLRRRLGPAGPLHLAPAAQVLTVEDRLQAQRSQLEVAELDLLALVVLQADDADRVLPIAGVEDPLAIVDHDKAVALGCHLEAVPLAGNNLGLGCLGVAHQAPGVIAAGMGVVGLQLVAGLVGSALAGRPQEHAAIAVGGGAELAAQLVVGEGGGAAQPAALGGVAHQGAARDLPLGPPVGFPAEHAFAVPQQYPALGDLLRGEAVRGLLGDSPPSS